MEKQTETTEKNGKSEKASSFEVNHFFNKFLLGIRKNDSFK